MDNETNPFTDISDKDSMVPALMDEEVERPDWLVSHDHVPPDVEYNGVMHKAVLVSNDGHARIYSYPTAEGGVGAVRITQATKDDFGGKGMHVLTQEERMRGVRKRTHKKQIGSYLTGLMNKQNLTPRQVEYVRHIKNNDFTSLVKQMTADLLASSDDPVWLHSIYKDLIKMIPKHTIIDMNIKKEETHKVDLSSLGLTPIQQSKLADYMLTLLDEEKGTINIVPKEEVEGGEVKMKYNDEEEDDDDDDNEEEEEEEDNDDDEG